MRTLSASQSASFSSEALSLASLVTITQNDGTVIMLTDHDVDIGAWKAKFGLDLSAVAMQIGGGGQTATFSTFADDGTGGGVTYAAIEGSLLDAANVKCYRVDFNVSPVDPIIIFSGYVSEIVYGNADLLTFTVNTPLSTTRPLCGQTMSQTCRADFGDAGCKIDIHPLVDGPNVYAPADDQSFVMSRSEVTPPGYYNNGTLYFNTGANKGIGYEVLAVSDADANGRETVTLKVPLAHDVANGDNFLLYPGCDKVITSGCTYWNNTANFQGEPFIADPSNILPSTAVTGTSTSSGVQTGLPADINWLLTQYIQTGFNQYMQLANGTRFTDEDPGAAIATFNDFLIPPDAYNTIFNALGGTDNVVAYDGTLKPKDLAGQAQLTTAGFTLSLNLNVAAITIYDAGNPTQVDLAVSPLFYTSGAPS